jgi:PilZ domain-containing protein
MNVPRQGHELRTTRRFSLRLPVEVKYSAESVKQAKAHTRDVSSRGICFYFDSHIQPGSDIEFTLTLPPEITLTESIRVRCKGTVVRVEAPPAPGGKVGIAATIQHYEFLAEK